MSISPNPHNLIEGMTLDRLTDRAEAYFPYSVVKEDNEGNLVIVLNHRLENGVVTPLVEDTE